MESLFSDSVGDEAVILDFQEKQFGWLKLNCENFLHLEEAKVCLTVQFVFDSRKIKHRKTIYLNTAKPLQNFNFAENPRLDL